MAQLPIRLNKEIINREATKMMLVILKELKRSTTEVEIFVNGKTINDLLHCPFCRRSMTKLLEAYLHFTPSNVAETKIMLFALYAKSVCGGKWTYTT